MKLSLETIENKRKAINARNLAINDLWEKLHSLFTGYEKEILKVDGSFRKDIKTATDVILSKYRGKDNIRLYLKCEYGKIILKTDACYSTGEHTCDYADKNIDIAVINDAYNKIVKVEEIEYLCVFNKDCVMSVINELTELEKAVEIATNEMNAVKYGPYHEFL